LKHNYRSPTLKQTIVSLSSSLNIVEQNFHYGTTCTVNTSL